MARRILVVEDDEKSRRLLKDVLEYHGFDVCAYANGEDGLCCRPRQANVCAATGLSVSAVLDAGGVALARTRGGERSEPAAQLRVARAGRRRAASRRRGCLRGMC